jgi:uncharacterized protein (DUF1697 family)
MRASVALLKGVNVGGHRTFRPSILAKELKRYDVVNIGAAGTFVVRAAVDRATLRAEIARRLPFETEVVICSGADVLRLVSADPFAGHVSDRNIVPFVIVLVETRPQLSPLPFDLPSTGGWHLRILANWDQFVVGLYRREMKALSYLAQVEKIVGVPVTTRTWNTVLRIARILNSGRSDWRHAQLRRESIWNNEIARPASTGQRDSVGQC